MVGSSDKVKNMFKKKFPSLSSLGSDGNTSFLRAARAGHLDKVLEQLRNNVDINTSNANGLNALHLASKDGHVHVVTELLKRGANVDSATKKGNTALHIASLAGQEDVVKLLVEHGASVNVQSQNGFTPLYMAAQENHDNVVKYLLSNGANQSLATEDGFTPLAVAMQQGHDKVVAVLLENDTRGKVRLPALHIASKKDDCKAAALLLQNEHNPDVTSKSGFTPLHIASHYGNEGIANLLLNKGADVNYSAKHNITPLHVAAKWGKSNMVSLLLEKGANIESKTRDGLTPLHCAARSGHEQVVDMLLERGAPISCKTKNGLAPLHMSSQGDHVDAARILLYHRAPVDEVTVDYLTALHVAAHCGHARVAKLLLDRKADPNARALNGFTPLHIACKKNRIKVVELLLKHGASIEATTESGLTPLHVASFMGCMNIVIYLLQNDASPDVPTVRGETPLHLAARANQTDIIRILLRNGAQVDARAREQQTPLHIASRLGNVDIVMLLLQHGAFVDCNTKDLYSALHIAAKEGQDEVAAVLLDNGASPTFTTKKGFTPLHLAAKYGHMKVAKLLLQKDAPVDAQGKNGVTPLHVASHYDHQNVALLLLDKGASPHASAKNGHTPLHIAARKNQMDIATTLLEYGAKASAESKAGFTPLHLSAQEGHTDMSCLLIDHNADTNHKAKNGLTPLHLCAQEDRVNVASVLVKNGAEVDSTTKAGYTPLHVACHFGQLNMVKFLLDEGSKPDTCTTVGYTPLHQAAQQGHCAVINTLLDRGAPPNATTNQGQTAMSIAQKLGYISVVETLKGVTEVTTITPLASDEKYKVVSPETMQETFMSDSEDEGGEDTLLSEQPYRYLTVDEMKSLGDDSLPIDVRQDERMDSNRECMSVPPTAVDDTISPHHMKESYSQFNTPDNIDISKHPLHVGFLVSFLVDARGGAMRGCRHSGVRLIVPPRRASMPLRVTCRYLRRDKLSHPPPLMEGEALASRILELGPVGAKFLGPVMIEVPHFGSLRGKEREIVILRSDNGETWREHTVDCSEEAVQDVLNHSFEKEDMVQLDENGRTTRILTTDFPHYFAVVTRVRQEVHAIGPEGGMVSSSVVPQVQAVFPQGALTKKIKVGLQAQPISAELAAKLLGNRVAVSPIVTVEPRRRKFHKPITLTIPKPQAANKGMINQYSGDAPTLRLLCSITGGTTRAQWEDVTGSTPFTFVNDCVSFTTTVSARFWLMDCRNVGDATKMATELYREAIHVPFMAKFVVFAKRVDTLEARLRIFCMTDDKEDKTLEHQEHFTEVAKSRDVEVLEGKTQYVEFAGNLVPVTKSGEQLQLNFRAFRENRLPFTVRVKDPHADCVGRTLFMREARLPKGEPPQQPICVLNIVLPEEIIPEATLAEHELHKYSYIQDSSGLESYQRVDLRLSDISNLLGDDWVQLADVLEVNTSDINRLKTEHPQSVAQQGLAMLRLWLSQAGNKAQASTLESALSQIGRDDIVQQCVFNVDQSGLQLLKDDSRDASLRRSIPYSDKDIMKNSESVDDLSRTSLRKARDYHDKDDKEERKYEAEEKEVEEVKKSVTERRQEIEKRLSIDKQLEKKAELISRKISTETIEDYSEKEIAEEKRVSSPDEEPSELSFAQKRLSFEQGKRVIEMKPDKTTMKEVKERALDDKFLAEERKAAETLKEKKSLVDETSIPFHEKRKSFEQKEENEKDKKEDQKKEDLRRDSALFEGVSQGLVRLDAAFVATPQAQDLLSPKVSKTPPPSPAEFKDLKGTAAWAEEPLAVKQPKQDQSQDWAEKGKPDSTVDPSNKEVSRQVTDEPGPTAADISLPKPSPRPKSDISSESPDLQSNSEDLQDYSTRKKFWEQISSSSQESQRSQDIVTPPVAKPRSSIVSSVSLLKSEAESDTETTVTTLGDSTIRIKSLQQDAVSKQSFTGSSDASDKEEGSETEAADKLKVLSSVSTTAESVVPDTTEELKQQKLQAAAESSDSEAEYISKVGEETLAYENTGFVPDDETDSLEISKLDDKPTPADTKRKTRYERSVSLPTEDITDVSVSSVKAKKRFFETQIKKEMVVDQLMMQLEEEASPEHKSFHHKPSSVATSDPEAMVSRQIHSHIFSHELEEQIESLVPESKHISQQPQETDTVTFNDVKEVTTSFDTVDAKKVIKRTDSVIHEAEIVKAQESVDSSPPKSIKDIRDVFENTNQITRESLDDRKCIEKPNTFEQVLDFGEINILESQHQLSEEIVEVMKYRSDSISKPSDSLEVHIDKSEIEESEKDIDIDEEIKQMEDVSTQDRNGAYNNVNEEKLPEITITHSLKPRPDSYSQGESEDTQSESDITPEDLRDKEVLSKLHDWDQEIIVHQIDEKIEKKSSPNISPCSVSRSPHVHTPEEHIPDTVWEVPIQQEAYTSNQETVEDIPIEKQPIIEKDEEESQRSLTESCEMKSDTVKSQPDVETDHNEGIDTELSLTESALEFKGLHTSDTLRKCQITEDEAREVAKEIVNHIEVEIAKRSDISTDLGDITSTSVVPALLHDVEVSDYIKKLTGKEDLEVKLIESVLAKKQREQILKLSRADTTSSVEITDEDLRSSGVETDNSPVESQGSRLCHVEDKSEDDTTEDFLKHEKDLEHDLEKIKEKEVLEKTLAEVKESLEAAQDELIEEQKQKQEVLKKQSPSEFQFKALTLEKYADEYIQESLIEEVGISIETQKKSDDNCLIGSIDAQIKEIKDNKSEVHSKVTDEIGHIKEPGLEKISFVTKFDTDQKQTLQTDTEVSENVTLRSDKSEIKSSQRGSASFSDDEEKSSHSKISQNIISTSDSILSETVSEEKDKEILKAEKSFTFSEIKEEKTDGQYISKKEHKKEDKKIENFEETFDTKKDVTLITEDGNTVTETITEQRHISTTSTVESREQSHIESKIQTHTFFDLDPEETGHTFSQGNVQSVATDSNNDEGTTIKVTKKGEIKRTYSGESQKSSQDESIKSPTGLDGISSSSSSGRKGDSDTMHSIERPDVVMRKHKTGSSANQKRSDRRSGAEYEPYSSSGESYYHSFEQTSESMKTPSRPCSSDVEFMVAGVGTTGSSEYESAVSFEARSFTSHEYHTAVSSLSSRESMKSLDSESSGNLASVEISSEASETLIPSAMELDSDVDEAALPIMDEDKYIKHKKLLLEPYERDIPHHIIKGESPPRIPSLSEVRDYNRSISLELSSEGGVSEEDADASGVFKDISTMDVSSRMKRSHEMTFQPEPRPITSEELLQENITHEEKYASSLDDSVSVLSSSMSDTAAIKTVIERSRTESERMDGSATSDQLSLTVSGTSEQLSLSSESRDDISIQQTAKHETVATQSSNSNNQIDSVLIMTSSITTDGVQSVCTQVTSQSEISVKPDENVFEEELTCSNGPTQVDYNAEYDDVKKIKKRPGHRRNESTIFKPSAIPVHKKRYDSEVASKKNAGGAVGGATDYLGESEQYTESKVLTSKEWQNDEKKDVDEAEKIEDESYHTEADQGFHRDMREARQVIEGMSSLEDDHEELLGLEESRPQSQISKSDSESGHRHMSSGFSDDRPDSELAELLKQCSSDVCIEDPIERPKTPEPFEDCEIKDDTPEFSSEAQASVTELEMEYSGAFSRTVEYESHVSPIREKVGLIWDHASSDHEEELAEAEAAFQMVPHVIPHVSSALHPDTIPEDPAAEKHELETRERDMKEVVRRRAAQIEATSPGSIPDITVTQHMTPLIDRGFHYPDLELEETTAKESTPQTPASMSSRASSETETDQGREYVLEDIKSDDLMSEEPDIGDASANTEEKTVFESKEKFQKRDSATDSPDSDSFELLEKPDITDDFVIIEEVGKEAQEQDQEGKSVIISQKRIVKKVDDTEEEILASPPAPVTRMTDIKYYPSGEAPFPFDSDSPPTNVEGVQSTEETSQEGSPPTDSEQYESEVEAGKKWIEMQFQGDQATAVYGYELDYERGPLEDIKEEEATDLENSSSKFGSLGSQVSQSAGSFGSMKESFSSTPDYDVLAGRRYFTRSGEHDDVSMSSLQEFERLETMMAMEISKNRSSGSQDSLNSSGKSNRQTGSGKSGGDDISLASLKEFEGLEHACMEAARIEMKAKEDEALLSEIEEGHESQASESESCETISAINKGGDSDEDDYEKRMFEIDEIIRQAQTNVERFTENKEKDSLTESSVIEKTESMGRGDSVEEVAKIPDLDLDQPLCSLSSAPVSSYPLKNVSAMRHWKDMDEEVRTSTDSLEIKPGSKPSHHDTLTTSTDSLEVKNQSEKELMSASTDSIEFQAQQKKLKAKDIMTDSIEVIGDKTSMLTSTDSLETDPHKMFSDSIDEEDGMHIGGPHDHSCSSSVKGDLSSGREDSCGQLRMPPPRSELLMGSNDSLDPTSSAATHATYHYETDSMMSSSFTSVESNTLMSSTETLDAGARAAAWFDDGKPYVTEIIEPDTEGGFTHIIHRTVEMPPEIHNVTFRGPDADKALKDYIERFGPGEDMTETQEVDKAGNVHTTRVVQRRVVIRPDEFGGPTSRLSEDELDEYLHRFAEEPTDGSQSGPNQSSYSSQTIITRQAISSTPRQGLTSTHVKGESAGEETSKSPIPPTSREGEEALMDFALGSKDTTGSGASGPSGSK